MKAKTILLSADQYAVASLSPLGREVVWRRQSITLKWPTPHSQRPSPVPVMSPRTQKNSKKPLRGAPLPDTDRVLSAIEENIFQELKDWRQEEAAAQGVPAYIVFGNKTLKAIAIMRPNTYSELEKVIGVGPAKLEAYGDDILKLIKQLDCG